MVDSRQNHSKITLKWTVLLSDYEPHSMRILLCVVVVVVCSCTQESTTPAPPLMAYKIIIIPAKSAIHTAGPRKIMSRIMPTYKIMSFTLLRFTLGKAPPQV